MAYMYVSVAGIDSGITAETEVTGVAWVGARLPQLYQRT